MRTLQISKLPALWWALVAGLCLTMTAVAQTPETAPSRGARSDNSQTMSPSQTPAQSNPGSSASGSATTTPQASTPQSGSAQSGGNSVEDELQLTPDQKQKIATIVDDENRQIASVRDDNSLSLQQKQQKVMQIRQDGSPKIKAILTPEQLQKLAAFQQRMREQQSGQQGAGTSPSSSPSQPQTATPPSTPSQTAPPKQ